jgi:hypothetical protein
MRNAVQIGEAANRGMSEMVEENEGHLLCTASFLALAKCICRAKAGVTWAAKAGTGRLIKMNNLGRGKQEKSGSVQTATGGTNAESCTLGAGLYFTTVQTLAIAGNGAQFTRQKVVRRPRAADCQLTVFQLLGGA